MTGFYKNMATGDYDGYRDTDVIVSHHPKKNENTKPSARQRQRRFTSEDLRPVGEDDYDY